MNGQTPNPGNLSFQPAPVHPFGYSRLDVVWSGHSIPNNGTNYWLKVDVQLNGGSSANGQCVEETLTAGSLNPVLEPELNTFSISSGSINLIVTDVATLNLTNPMTLFSIHYVASPGTSVSFEWDDNPNTNGVFDLTNLVFYDCTLGPNQSDFFPARTISGSIYKAPISQSNCTGGTDAAVTGVNVNLFSNEECSPAQGNQAMVNLSDGSYAFTAVNEEFNYSITPIKTNNPDCGVNTTDVTMIIQHVLGNALLQYPYQAVAADMNLSNTVTIYDAVLTLQLINGTFEAPYRWNSWTFPPAWVYGLFPPVTSSGYQYPGYDEYISHLNLNGDKLNQDFVGIKRGDVDGSCSNCDAMLKEKVTEDRSPAVAAVRFRDQPVEAGSVYELPLYISGMAENTAAIAFALSLPTDYFEILSVKDGALPNLQQNFFNWEAMDDGLLRFACLDFENKGLALHGDDPLFYLVVEAKRNLPSLKELLRLRPDVQDCSLTTSGLERRLLSLETDQTESPVEGFALFPNPAHEQVTFEFDVTADAPVMLYLYDASGRVLSLNEYHFAAGQQSLALPTDGLPNGLISYRLVVGDTNYSGRFIKQD
ncbi:MAG TPA: hypothetical protein ENJ20_03480 [Bacteroidetes bacterium]|nr:hypothetical protein [Bacteroidota bacterium]